MYVPADDTVFHGQPGRSGPCRGAAPGGELVAIPTETVYGLAADAENGPAVARIFEAKGRPMDNPLIVHIADWDTLPRLAAEIPDTAVKHARHTGPGR